MTDMDYKHWAFIILFICVKTKFCFHLKGAYYKDIAKETMAVYCGYKTSTGVIQHTYCMEICCEGRDITFENVCCRYVHESHMYVGGGLGALVMIVSIVTCVVYSCCKNRCSQQGRESESHLQRNDPLPTISLQIQPPPYDLHPPPYFAREQGTSTKKEECLTLPDGPPPSYSLHDTLS